MMINTNFTKQDNQNPLPGDLPDKDAKADEFSALMAGLCMTPPSGPVTPIPVSEKPAAQGDVEFPGPEGQTNSASPASDGKVLPAGDDIKAILADADAKSPACGTDIRSAQGGTEPALAVGDTKPLSFEDASKPGRPYDGGRPPLSDIDVKPDVQIAAPIKAIVKDLKTQANKFEGIPVLSGSIAGAKNFAALTKEKTLIVQGLAGAQIHLDPAAPLSTDTAPEPTVTHFDHNYVVDPVRLADFIQARADRKLPRLISDISDIATSDNTSVLPDELAAKIDAPALPRAAEMLEQIRPALIQLAAAAANEGKQILKMRLHPAELGTVEIRLEKNDSGVLEAHFRTDTDSAKHFLTQGLAQLRDALQNAGWQVGKMEISSSSFSSANADGGEGSAHKDARQRDETSSNGSAKRFGPDPAISDGRLDASADHLVSLRA
jgi:hypothetical protein